MKKIIIITLYISIAIAQIQHGGIPKFFNNDLDRVDFIEVETDLIVAKKQDIDLERILQSWRGTRHSLNLKVRGQRTRCTGRAGKVVGVRKSTLKPGKAS